MNAQEATQPNPTQRAERMTFWELLAYAEETGFDVVIESEPNERRARMVLTRETVQKMDFSPPPQEPEG